MISRALLLGAALGLVATSAFAQTKSPVAKGDPALALSPIDRDFKAVCGSCHSTSLVGSQPRSRADWMETLEAMIARGATGTDDQLDNVVRYLDANLTKLNINTAEQDEIGSVLDVPDSVAAAVVKRRRDLGKFKSLAEVAAIPGIDAVKLEHRRPRILF